MMLMDDPITLWQQRNHYPFQDYLVRHLDHVQALQYCSGHEINQVCGYLSELIADFAATNCPVYRGHSGPIDRNRLDGGGWFVEDQPYQPAWTNGSTTGERFHYRRWSKSYYKIERDNHYLAIINEFMGARPSNVLYLMMDQGGGPATDEFAQVYQTNNVMLAHGLGRTAQVHQIFKNRLYYRDHFEFFRQVIDYCVLHEIEVILASPSVVSALAWHGERLRPGRICALLSATGDKVNYGELDRLKNLGLIEQWCDHMRCWDGGITFFTCRYGTRHLLDGLAWSWSDHGRLISNDFYSLASPFVGYYNGDSGTVCEEFKHCPCGRSYRKFDITRTRAIALTGLSNRAMVRGLVESGVDTGSIRRMEPARNFLRIVTIRPFTSTERQGIRELWPHLEVNFVVES